MRHWRPHQWPRRWPHRCMVLFAFLVSNMLASHFFFCDILKFRELETPGSMVLMVWMDQEIDQEIRKFLAQTFKAQLAVVMQCLNICVESSEQYCRKCRTFSTKSCLECPLLPHCFLMFLAWPSLILGLHSIKIQRKIWCSLLNRILPLVVSVG
jgi:hypothetical protein